MSTAQLRELVEQGKVVGLTLDQYVQMIDAHILPETPRVELVDGLLVLKDRSKAGEDPMSIGLEHVWAVNNLGRIFGELEKGGHHIRLQQPIAVPPESSPEPDGAIVRGTNDDYRRRYPSPKDVVCVIEVADSSLDFDRSTKKRVYAGCGISRYLIVNLVEGCVEVFESPAESDGVYLRSSIRRGSDAIEFSIGDGFHVTIEAARFLPG